jgi:hypothetical protein
MTTRVWAVQRARLRTGRGIATTICTVLLIVVAGLSSGTNPGGVIAAGIILGPLFWFPVWWLVGVVMGGWGELVHGSPPQVRVGRQWQSSGSTRQQLREDSNADLFFDRGGIQEALLVCRLRDSRL